MRATRSFWVGLAIFYAGILAIIGVFALVAGATVGEAHRNAIPDMLAEAARALIYAAGILLFGLGNCRRTPRVPLAASTTWSTTTTVAR